LSPLDIAVLTVAGVDDVTAAALSAGVGPSCGGENRTWRPSTLPVAAASRSRLSTYDCRSSWPAAGLARVVTSSISVMLMADSDGVDTW